MANRAISPPWPVTSRTSGTPANAPLALAATKRIIVESADWPAAQAFARQAEITAPVFGSKDAMEGAAAFAQKRPPAWRGE